jgi:hypothetical protein
LTGDLLQLLPLFTIGVFENQRLRLPIFDFLFHSSNCGQIIYAIRHHRVRSGNSPGDLPFPAGVRLDKKQAEKAASMAIIALSISLFLQEQAPV